MCFKRYASIGVIYYLAITSSLKTGMIVCFDVRSEKFVFITTMKTPFFARLYCGTLTNYNGKLGILFSEVDSSVFGSSRSSVELWVLEDLEKQEWSTKQVNTYYLLCGRS